MKDASTILRTAYYSALNGNLTDLASANVEVFDRVPNTVTDYTNIQLGEYTATEAGTKTGFTQDVTQQVIVVTGFSGNDGGKKESDNLTDQIMEIIRTKSPVLDLTPTFTMMNSVLDGTTSFEEKTNTHTILRRVIVFRHLIDET